MSNFKDGCYSCNPGTELLAKVIAGKCKMYYTRAAVGCGEIPVGKTPETMSEPADYVMDALISNVSVPVDGQCQVTIQINSKNVETGFWATCILLYAQDPDIGEVPYTYLVLENNPEWIKSADSDMAKLAVFDLITAVGSIENVSADIAPDAVITRSEVDDIVSRKVDKVSGKGLSTEDFTTAEKNKLSGIETGATAVSSSTANGNVKINGVETTVYTHPSGTNPHGTTKADVGLGNVGNFKAVSTAASQGLSDTEKSNARANIGAGTSNFDGNYNSLSNKPTIPTTLPASDVYPWAKAASKPSYTASEVGAAAASHTHSYAGSSSVGGAANSAVRLQTPRSISIGGLGLMGSAYFDGSSDIMIPACLKYSRQYDDTANVDSYPWHKFAEATFTQPNSDHAITFAVSKTYGWTAYSFGILTAHIRLNTSKAVECAFFKWDIATEFVPIANFVLVYTNTSEGVKVELWHKHTSRFEGWFFTVLMEHNSYDYVDEWIMTSASGTAGSANYTTGTKAIVSGLHTIQNPVKS